MVDSDIESVPINRRINSAGLADQSLIVIGEGFIASISTKDFSSSLKWIEGNNTSNYSILVTEKQSSTFFSCFENKTDADCSKCSNAGCKKLRPLPPFVMKSIVVFTEVTGNDMTLMFFTTTNAYGNEFLTVMRSKDDEELSRGIKVKLKPHWAYNTESVSRSEAKPWYYALSKVAHGGKNKKSVMLEVEYIPARKRIVYVQMFVSESLGVPVSFIPSSSPDKGDSLYLLTKTNRIGKAEFRYPRPYSNGQEIFLREGSFHAQIGGSNDVINVTELHGINDTLWTNEFISSGIHIKGSQLLYLGTQQGRMLKVSNTCPC